MTKVYELPNGHRMVADIDESTRVCNITETTLDSLVSKLNYYAEQTDVLDKIRAEIEQYQADCNLTNSDEIDCKFCDSITFDTIYRIIDKYRNEVSE